MGQVVRRHDNGVRNLTRFLTPFSRSRQAASPRRAPLPPHVKFGTTSSMKSCSEAFFSSWLSALSDQKLYSS